MKKILVAGDIASGKTEVCRYLESKGFPVYYSDDRAKALYDEIPGLKAELEELTGLPYGRWNELFDNPDKLEIVESRVHSAILDDFCRWSSALGAGMVFFESAIALDKPLFRDVFDLTVIVRAPLELRQKRNPKVFSRNALQVNPLSAADFVIENDSDIESLHKKTDILISRI